MFNLIDIGFLTLNLVDIIDIFLVAFLFFRLYKLLKGSVGLTIFIGLLSIYLLYLLVKTLQMEMLTTILGQFIGVGVIATIILFQQEIRRFLILVGKTAFMNNRKILQYLPWRKQVQEEIIDVAPVVEASKTLSGSKTGALIVFKMMDGLTTYQESGDELDAKISKRLLVSIFNKESPLHDGAVIVDNGRIASARSILPVTQKDDLPASMGLRHRAAVGLTEETDAVVVVISEETGQISVIRRGRVHANLSFLELRNTLRKFLSENIPGTSKPEENKEG